ncbi:MAG: glycosyl hydrolase, partial [Mesorhizobium sp.]
MALLGMMIKSLMAALLALAALAPAGAATFSMKRGLNLDQWVTWPTEDKWSDRR